MILALALALARVQNKPIVLMAVGDVMLDRYVGKAIEEHGTAYTLARVQNTLSEADVVFANLECPITSAPKELKKRFVFRVPPNRAEALTIDRPLFLSLANNHTLDCGRIGLQETEKVIDPNYATTIGSGQDPWEPKIFMPYEAEIAFLAYSDFPERVAGNGPRVAYYDEMALRHAIARARKAAKFVVVAVHWGVEGDSQPSERQRHEAKVMADAGADLILGSHPHVLQPAEWIKRADGHKTCVVYSMGDFVFDTIKPKEQRSAIFRFVIRPDGISDVKQIPVRIRNARPELVTP